MQKLQAIKKKIVRQSPKVVALTGATMTGAFLMYRYCDNMNHLISVHTGIVATLKQDGGGFVFQTPVHGSYVLAPVVKL